jgi:hypothetical protein
MPAECSCNRCRMARRMSPRLIRRVAVMLIALLAFAHGSLALAACGMDRGSMAQAMVMSDMPDCDSAVGDAPAPGAVCASHCSSDLQFPGLQVPLVRGAATVPVLVVEMRERHFEGAQLAAPPHPAPPRRILLHSFLI